MALPKTIQTANGTKADVQPTCPKLIAPKPDAASKEQTNLETDLNLLPPAGIKNHSHDWFVIIDPALAEAAKQAINIWNRIYSECEQNGTSLDVAVMFPTKAAAKKARLFIRGVTLAKSKKFECVVEEFLASSFAVLGEEVSQAGMETFIRLKREDRKWAKQYLKVFSNYETIELPATSEITVNQLQTEQEAVALFLRRLINNCQETRPRQARTVTKPHSVLIKSIQREVVVDGEAVKLNEPKKSALFLLKILGTKDISTKQFAGLYNKPLFLGKSKAPNCTNIFNQALKGLSEVLPRLQVKLGERVETKTVFGVKIKSQVANRVLETWVKNRGVKKEEAVVIPPSQIEIDEMIQCSGEIEGESLKEKPLKGKALSRFKSLLGKAKT